MESEPISVLAKYIVSSTIVAMGSDKLLTEIPAGAVVEGPVLLVAKGTVTVRHKDRLLTVLALDFLDTAQILTNDYD